MCSVTPVTTTPPRPKRRNRSKPKYTDGTAVRRKRVEAGLSQEALAELAGVSQPHISAIELDISSSSVDVLHALATALGCEPSELMCKAS